jgi:hypothetical protein
MAKQPAVDSSASTAWQCSAAIESNIHSHAFASKQLPALIGASTALVLTYHDQLNEGVAAVQHLAWADLFFIMII